MKPIKPVKADWTDVVLVCRKCSRRLKGGFGPDGKLSLAKALRREVARADAGRAGKPKRKGTQVAVIEIGCLDVCPKDAVMLMHAAAPGEWLAIPAGTDAELLLARLREGAEKSSNS